nr:MAG TPA: Major head protein [Caudoviricetes sp.]
MTRNDVLKLFPDATDEQITNLLNKSGEEMAREKEKANQYKAKADKADELQTQLDELQNGNMTELEKANKALETANQQIAKLQKDNAVRDLRESAMSDFGITAEQAKTVVKEDGSFDTTSLGKIISDMKANAIAEYEKNALKDTPNPNNGGKKDEPDSKPADVANAEQISFGTVASAESQNSYVI